MAREEGVGPKLMAVQVGKIAGTQEKPGALQLPLSFSLDGCSRWNTLLR
jgi:hypothetical protein